MKKPVKKSKKKMTIEDLASSISTLSQEMKAGFSGQTKKINVLGKSLNNKIEEEIERLAIMTQNSFSSVEKRIDKVEGRLNNIENGQKKISNDILNLNEKFPTRFEFDNLSARVWNLENKKSKSSK